MFARKMRIGCLCCFLFISCHLFAAFNGIQTEKLPQTADVHQALSLMDEIDPYARYWNPNWSYPLPKIEAAAKAKRSLEMIHKAINDDPNNLELLLLDVLAGRYAYNLDLILKSTR